MRMKFGLIGTITDDEITFDSGQRITGLGGVLYQAAVLCGLGEETCLHTNLGEELADEVYRMVKDRARETRFIFIIRKRERESRS